MELASGEAASHNFVICIILLSVWERDLRKKYDCSQCIFHCFRSFLVCFFISGWKRSTFPSWICWREKAFVYLPTLTHYTWVSRLRTKDIDLTHQGQFLTPDSQIRTSCSKKTLFHFRFLMYYFFPLYKNHKSFQMSTIRSNRKCSKVVGISSDIFGNVRKSSEIVGNL